jgi:hypothetical protein
LFTKVKGVPNGRSEPPQRKPSVRERFRAGGTSPRCTAVREKRPSSWAFWSRSADRETVHVRRVGGGKGIRTRGTTDAGTCYTWTLRQLRTHLLVADCCFRLIVAPLRTTASKMPPDRLSSKQYRGGVSMLGDHMPTVATGGGGPDPWYRAAQDRAGSCVYAVALRDWGK